MKSIVKINKDILSFNNKMIESGGEITEEVEQELKEIENNLTTKAHNIAKVYRENNYTIEIIKKEMERLDSFKKSIENTNAFYKQAIYRAMKNMDINRLDKDGETLRIQKFKSPLEIDDEEKIPNSFKKVKMSVDRAKLRKALEDGEKIDGAYLKDNEGVVIKK